MTALNFTDVCEAATADGYQQSYFNDTCKVISFSKRDELDDSTFIRINVYWTTGTVGTCLNHPRQGKTQLFRRNVDLLTLRLIFKNPRHHTGYGYHKAKASTKSKRNDECVSLYHDFQITSDAVNIEDEESAAKAQMKWLDEEIDMMQKQKAQVQAILDHFVEKRRLKAAAEEAEKKRQEELRKEKLRLEAEEEEKQRIEAERLRVQNIRNERGKYIDYVTFQGYHVTRCFDEKVISMACGGQSTIFLYENGGWAWSAGLTKQLHNKLNGRQRHLPSPLYVSIGSFDRYYIRFEDGKSEWVGCDEMTDYLQQEYRTVKTVAFGEEWDSYFVLFEDGGWQSNNIPYGLSNWINRNSSPDLACVTLGPNGEYYVRAKDSSSWWGGIEPDNWNRMKKFRGRIKFMDFGDDDSYVIRYT